LKGLILLHLTADKGGASTGRKNVPSITEVLSAAKPGKDKGWVSGSSCMRGSKDSFAL
jgi:exocyst complex component 4